MGYINVDRMQLVSDLKHNVVEVGFIKVDGTERKMRCTLVKSYLPEPWVDDNGPERISVWDLDVKGWRSFYLDHVVYMQAVTGT